MSRATAEAPLFDFAEQNARVSEGGYHQPGPRLRGPARWRLLTVSVVFAVAFAAVGGKLMLNAAPRTVSPANAAVLPDGGGREFAPRASIVDRRGELLAYSLPFDSLYANPQEVRDPAKVAAALQTVLTDLKAASVAKSLANKKREFAYLARHLTPSQHSAILEMGIPGLYFRKEYRRLFPRGRLAAHVVGTVKEDHRGGLSGIEAFFDADLASTPDLPLALSIDMRVQHIVYEEVQRAIDRFDAIGGFGIMMDVNTGEVIASVSLPDFDPNRLETLTRETRVNKVAGGAYELGSMFKLLTSAAALDQGVASEQTKFDASKPLYTHGHKISDFRGENRWLTMREVLVHSSNIGAARMAELIGTPNMVKYLGGFGLFAKAGIELNESTRPILPAKWSDIYAKTASFGHGISVTPLQFVSAIGAVSNGGTLLRPTMLKVPEGTETTGMRVISTKTSARVRKLMRAVVVEGSGKGANSRFYHVGGKTGTAEKNINGRYQKDKRLSSFIGAFPIENPRYVVMVSVDEPKGRKDTLGYATGGWVSAPAVGKIVERVAPMLGIEKAGPEEKTQQRGLQTASMRVRH
jgi:cell division protein FtsI (penicillin-binding protein 3)